MKRKTEILKMDSKTCKTYRLLISGEYSEQIEKDLIHLFQTTDETHLENTFKNFLSRQKSYRYTVKMRNTNPNTKKVATEIAYNPGIEEIIICGEPALKGEMKKVTIKVVLKKRKTA